VTEPQENLFGLHLSRCTYTYTFSHLTLLIHNHTLTLLERKEGVDHHSILIAYTCSNWTMNKNEINWTTKKIKSTIVFDSFSFQYTCIQFLPLTMEYFRYNECTMWLGKFLLTTIFIVMKWSWYTHLNRITNHSYLFPPQKINSKIIPTYS
jgi:hypothetical protein